MQYLDIEEFVGQAIKNKKGAAFKTLAPLSGPPAPIAIGVEPGTLISLVFQQELL